MDYRIMYLRDSQYQPVGCLAIRINESKSVVGYGISVLNPLDKFDRSLARKIASGRMWRAPRLVIVPIEPNMHEITEAVMVHISHDKSVPSRARKAAKNWIKYWSTLPDDFIIS